MEVVDNDWGDSYASICRVDGDEKIEVGWIGGEPEDNTYYRTYAWILPALNEAYNLGKEGS